MSQHISLSSYARMRGCTLRAVQKAIESGRITEASVRGDDGRLAGVDPELADKLWARNTDPVEAAKSGRGPLAGIECPHCLGKNGAHFPDCPMLALPGEATDLPAAGRQALLLPHGGTSSDPAAGSSDAGSSRPQNSEYYDHRANREKSLAALAELELLEKRGELVRADDVTRAQSEIWRRVRDSVDKVFERADSVLANIPAAAPVRGRLRAEKTTIFRELSDLLAHEATAGADECTETVL